MEFTTFVLLVVRSYARAIAGVHYNDDKKLHLDGLEGFAYYWQELRDDSDYIFSRWKKVRNYSYYGAILIQELSDLVIYKIKMKSKRYC